MKTKQMILAIPAVAMLSAAPAFAGAPDEHGLYLGGSYSQAKVKNADEFDDDNSAYSFHIGTQLNQNFRVEASYIDFGSFGNNAVNADADGFTVGLKAGVPITEALDIYGQAGLLLWKTDFEVLGINGKDDGSELFYGVGAEIGLTQALHLRFEYNRYNLDFGGDDGDIDQALVGLSMYF